MARLRTGREIPLPMVVLLLLRRISRWGVRGRSTGRYIVTGMIIGVTGMRGEGIMVITEITGMAIMEIMEMATVVMGMRGEGTTGITITGRTPAFPTGAAI